MSIEIINQRTLTKRYDHTALEVLRPHLEELSRPKGESRRFRVVKPLPDFNEFIRRRNRKFTKAHCEIADLIFQRLEKLIKDLSHWESSIPEEFKQERIGNRLREMIPVLREVWDKLNSSIFNSTETAVYLPIGAKYESRNDELREIRDWLIILELHLELDSSLSDAISKCRIPSFQETKYEKHL